MIQVNKLIAEFNIFFVTYLFDDQNILFKNLYIEHAVKYLQNKYGLGMNIYCAKLLCLLEYLISLQGYTKIINKTFPC